MNARLRLGPEHLLDAGAYLRERDGWFVDQEEELTVGRNTLVIRRQQHHRGWVAATSAL